MKIKIANNRGKPSYGAGSHLQRARTQLNLHDEKTAAMYARTAYEQTVSKYCDDRHLQMPFYNNPAKITSEGFFNRLKMI